MEKPNDDAKTASTKADAFMERLNDSSSMRIEIDGQWVWLTDSKEDLGPNLKTEKDSQL